MSLSLRRSYQALVSTYKKSSVALYSSLSNPQLSGIAHEAELEASWTDETSEAEKQQLHSDHNRRWVFLGCPGVGKGTYASKLAKYLDIPHISTGDLVRSEVKSGSRRSLQVSGGFDIFPTLCKMWVVLTLLLFQLESIMKQGKLIPDEIIFELLTSRLEDGAKVGEKGFILDGFPRTTRQAVILDEVTNIDLVLNLKLREEVLISKCLGRRTCGECGGNYNIADIYLKAENGLPEIIMPPLSPPEACLSKMVVRSDDTEETVRKRLQSYWREVLYFPSNLSVQALNLCSFPCNLFPVYFSL